MSIHRFYHLISVKSAVPESRIQSTRLAKISAETRQNDRISNSLLRVVGHSESVPSLLNPQGTLPQSSLNDTNISFPNIILNQEKRRITILNVAHL